MNRLIKEFSNLRVLKRAGINYLDIPFFNHSKPTDPYLLEEVVDAVCSVINWEGSRITKIVSEEEYGGFLAVGVALKKRIPFTLAKQNEVHSINGIGVTFPMHYNSGMTIYLNGVEKGDRVVLIDDIIASGGTMIAMIRALKKAEVEIVDVVALLEEVNTKAVVRIKNETGYDVKSIIRLDVSDEYSKIVSTIFDK